MVVAVSLMLLLEVYSISLCSDLLHQYQQLVPDSQQSEILYHRTGRKYFEGQYSVVVRDAN